MAYNRYRGGGGRPERIPEEEMAPAPSPLPPAEASSPSGPAPAGEPAPAREGAPRRDGDGPRARDAPGGENAPRRDGAPSRREPPRPVFPGGGREPRPDGEKTPSGALHDIRSSLDGILSRLDPGRLETEDLLVLAILWLLYRDSGDRELLIAMGAYLFL